MTVKLSFPHLILTESLPRGVNSPFSNCFCQVKYVAVWMY